MLFLYNKNERKLRLQNLSANKGLFVDPKIANRLFQGEFFCSGFIKIGKYQMVEAVKKAFSPHHPTNATPVFIRTGLPFSKEVRHSGAEGYEI